jgi:mannose-6-phosphate isomerase
MDLALPDVLPLRPYYREMVWGGRGLAKYFGKDLPADSPIGESFELSAYEERESVVADGPLAGWDLARLTRDYGAKLLGQGIHGRNGGLFPLLIKLLDAQDDLSIQVHPDDAYAQAQRLGPRGKMEAWYVLHSDGGQVAFGLKQGVGAEQLQQAIATGKVEEAVEFYPVKRGDVVFMPPGTVHALCRGVVIYEVQQSSDLTFRLYDYDRPGMDGKPRQLHIESGLEVIDFGAELGAPVPAKHWDRAGGSETTLVESEYFTLEHGRVSGAVQRHSGASFAAITLIAGKGRVVGADGGFDAAVGDTFLVPAGRAYGIEGEECEYLVSAAV